MSVSRAERRRDREPRVRALFSEEHVGPVLDLFEILEYAWHDAHGDITPAEDIVDDVLLLSEGSIDRLIQVVRLAVADWRDVKVQAAQRRAMSSRRC